MTLMPMPTPPPVMATATLEDTLGSLLYAVNAAARDSAAADASSERRELATAALSLAQAYVALDPTVVAPQGVPPTALHPPQAQPAQPKKTVKRILRDPTTNRMSGVETEEG